MQVEDQLEKLVVQLSIAAGEPEDAAPHVVGTQVGKVGRRKGVACRAKTI